MENILKIENKKLKILKEANKCECKKPSNSDMRRQKKMSKTP